MKESPTNNSEGAPNTKGDPLEQALGNFEKQAASEKYSTPGLKRAIDRVRRAGLRLDSSPGELYANLANLTGRAAEVAKQHGQSEDETAFSLQQSAFQQVSEQLGTSPEGASQISPSTNPRRKTGRAAG